MSGRILTCFLLATLVAAAVLSAPAAASEHSAPSDGNMNPLAAPAWQGNLILWTAVVFLCLVLVLGKFAWRPIAEGLDRREKGVADQIAKAEEANRKAVELLAEHQRRLDAAGDEVRAVLEQGRRHAEQLSTELLEKAKQDAKAEQERALRQIDEATDAAMRGLADRSATLAVELAGRIVHAKLNPRDHAAMVDQAVGGFMRSKDQNGASQNH